MATVRIGDFSGGTSEVLDPSLIAPNAAVASYNLDPRTGVFTPVFGLQEVSTTGSQFIDFIECDNKHEAILSPQPRCYVRWGDYLLWSYPNTGFPAQAAKFNSSTGDRTELRDLGLPEVTAAENANVSLAPIRATALTFKDGEHNLTGDVLLNIEAATNDPSKQYQRVAFYRETIVLAGDADDGTINVGPGDFIIMFPPYDASGAGTVLCGIPCTVVSVIANGVVTPGSGDPYPAATVEVSRFGSYTKVAAPGTSFGIDGFNEVAYGASGVPAFTSSEPEAILIKRETMTFSAMLAVARNIRSSGSGQVPVDATARQQIAQSNGGTSYTRTGPGITGVPAAWYEAFLYDYVVRTVGESKVLLATESTFLFGNGSQQANPPTASKYDIIHYWDETPGAVAQDGKAIIGTLETGEAQGLTPGIYKYAVTRVDDWGRESAPWPYLTKDSEHPRIDATNQSESVDELNALFIALSGLPQVPADWKLNIYRTRADGAQYFFLRKLDAGADFVDTVSDWDLSVIPMLAEQNYPPLVVPVDEEAKTFEEHPPQFLCEYRGTLFAAFKNRLMFSAPGKFYAWPPGNWVLLPANITGILPAGDVLLVFTRTKTFRLTGNTFSTADFREVSDKHGCVANRTAKLVDKRPFWCSLNGVATFDGVRVSIVTDGILADSSEQWKGATAACSYRGEYYLLLTPTRIEPTRTRKGEPIPNEIEPRQRYYLRLKPGAWVTHGVFTGQATDFAPNPSDGKLYVVHGGRVSKMFSATTREAGYWKSGLLHGGFKTLRKNAKSWFCTVTEGQVRVQIESDKGEEIVDRYLGVGNHFIDFKGGVFARGLSFAFTGAGVVTEYGYDFQEGQAQ